MSRYLAITLNWAEEITYPLRRVRIHSVRNKKYNYGFYGKHLSANAGKPENADFSDNHLGVVGSKMGNKGELTGKLDYERHVVHFMGMTQIVLLLKNVKSTKFSTTLMAKCCTTEGTTKNALALQLGFNFYTFGTHGNRRENDFEGSFRQSSNSDSDEK